jgi:LEA14-like dessication related protein
LATDREDRVHAALLLAVFIMVSAVVYDYGSAHPSGGSQESLIGNLELRSSSVVVKGADDRALAVDIKATVYNPNVIGAALEEANYSVYDDGHYVGSGRTVDAYELGSLSSQTFLFPISVGWGSALDVLGGYVLGWGHLTLEVKGTAIVEVGSLPLTVPFEFTVG